MVVLIVIAVIIVLLALPVIYYAHRNLTLDDSRMKKVIKAGFTEKSITLPNGTVLNYGEGGESSNPPLLLLHGQGQAWRDYDAVLPSLAESFHVFALDCHGHGKSSHDKSRYSCKLMTEDFVQFLRNVIGTPCVISGHSSGGILATATAAACPELAAALVIEDAPFFCVEPDEMQEKNAIVWTDSFKLMHEYQSSGGEASFVEYYVMHSLLFSLFGNLNKTIAASAAKFREKHAGEPFKLWYVPQSILRGVYYGDSFDLDFAATFYDGSWLDGISQEELLKSVSCPTTYMKAKTGYLWNNKMTYDTTGVDFSKAVLCCANRDEDAQRVVSLIKGCKLVKTETNDHLIHLKYPELFTATVCEYLKKQ